MERCLLDRANRKTLGLARRLRWPARPVGQELVEIELPASWREVIMTEAPALARVVTPVFERGLAQAAAARARE